MLIQIMISACLCRLMHISLFMCMDLVRAGAHRISGADDHAELPAADLPAARLWWTFSNVAIHVMWGFYPVAARWLQTRPGAPHSLLAELYYRQFKLLILTQVGRSTILENTHWHSLCPARLINEFDSIVTG